MCENVLELSYQTAPKARSNKEEVSKGSEEVYNFFSNTFTTRFMSKVVTSSNLNPLLKLFFYLPILTNNNLLLKIYYETL